MSKKLSLVLRGHIRNSFDNNQLYDFVKDLTREFDMEIYIQTWNILQTDVSWRHLERNETPVDEDLIYDYFDDISGNIKKIIILDDSKIDLIGIKTGRMGKTSGSYLGWKQMWYGIYEITEYIKDSKEEKEEDNFIINTRFDVFNNSVSFSLKTIRDKTMEVMSSTIIPRSILKNIFLKEIEFFGIDNFYIGNKTTLFKLAERFKYHLDEIIDLYPKVTSHEFYTFHVNNILFLENWLPVKKTEPVKPLNKFEQHEKMKKTPIISELKAPDSVNNNELSVNIDNKKTINVKPLSVSNVTRSTESIDLSVFKNKELPPIDKIPDNKSSEEYIIISDVDIKKPIILSETNSKVGKKMINKKEPTDNKVNNLTEHKNFVLPSAIQNKDSKMHLIETIGPASNATIDINSTQILTIPTSIQGRNINFPTFETNANYDTSSIVADEPSVSVLASLTQTRNANGKMTLLNKNITPGIVIDNVISDPKNPTILTSTQTRNNKMTLLDSTTSLPITSDNTSNILILPPVMTQRNNNMALLESNNALSTTTVNLDQDQTLSVLPSMVKNKDTRFSLSNTNLLPTTVSSVTVSNNQSALGSANVSRKGSVSLVNSTIIPSPTINSKSVDFPVIASSLNRSSKPLLNVTNIDTRNSNLHNGSSITLINKRTRTNASTINMNQKEVTPTTEPSSLEPSVIGASAIGASAIEPISTQVEVLSEEPVVVERESLVTSILESSIAAPNPVDNSISETSFAEQIVTIPQFIPKRQAIIRTPVPISKFSVTLDPNYLNPDTIVPNLPVTTISNSNTKLIHGNKFKTTTQSLSAYYALLSN